MFDNEFCGCLDNYVFLDHPTWNVNRERFQRGLTNFSYVYVDTSRNVYETSCAVKNAGTLDADLLVDYFDLFEHNGSVGTDAFGRMLDYIVDSGDASLDEFFRAIDAGNDFEEIV